MPLILSSFTAVSYGPCRRSAFVDARVFLVPGTVPAALACSDVSTTSYMYEQAFIESEIQHCYYGC